jgi:hypothetical protein
MPFGSWPVLVMTGAEPRQAIGASSKRFPMRELAQSVITRQPCHIPLDQSMSRCRSGREEEASSQQIEPGPTIHLALEQLQTAVLRAASDVSRKCPLFAGSDAAVCKLLQRGLAALLHAEAQRTGSRLDEWLRHSHENPRGCIAVEHGIKGTDVMLALSTLRLRRGTTSRASREKRKPAHETQQATEGARRQSCCCAHTPGLVHVVQASQEVQQRHGPLAVVVPLPSRRGRVTRTLAGAG